MRVILALLALTAIPVAAAQEVPVSAVGRIYARPGETALATLISDDLVITTAAPVMGVRKNPSHVIYFTPGQTEITDDRSQAIPGKVIDIDSLYDTAIIKLSRAPHPKFARVSVETNLPPEVALAFVASQDVKPTPLKDAGFWAAMYGTDLKTQVGFRADMRGAPVLLPPDETSAEWRIGALITGPCPRRENACAVPSSHLFRLTGLDSPARTQ